MNNLFSSTKTSSIIINDNVVERSDKTKDKLLEEAQRLKKKRDVKIK